MRFSSYSEAMRLPLASRIARLLGQRLGLELGGQVVHALATSLAHAHDAANGIARPATSDAQHRGHGRHHAEVGRTRRAAIGRCDALADMVAESTGAGQPALPYHRDHGAIRDAGPAGLVTWTMSWAGGGCPQSSSITFGPRGSSEWSLMGVTTSPDEMGNQHVG